MHPLQNSWMSERHRQQIVATLTQKNPLFEMIKMGVTSEQYRRLTEPHWLRPVADDVQ